MMNWVVVDKDGLVVRYYPHDDQGYDTAYAHARKFGYSLWEAFGDGEPRYLIRAGSNNS